MGGDLPLRLVRPLEFKAGINSIATVSVLIWMNDPNADACYQSFKTLDLGLESAIFLGRTYVDFLRLGFSLMLGDNRSARLVINETTAISGLNVDRQTSQIRCHVAVLCFGWATGGLVP